MKNFHWEPSHWSVCINSRKQLRSNLPLTEFPENESRGCARDDKRKYTKKKITNVYVERYSIADVLQIF